MPGPLLAAGGSAAASAAADLPVASMGVGALAGAGASAHAAGRHGTSLLHWFAGAVGLSLLLVVLLPVLVLTTSSTSASSTEQIGTGSPIPSGLVPVFNMASQAFNVNPYLLASVAYQESTFGSGGSWTQVNSAGCVGFMQICIGGQGGDTWDETVSLTGSPNATVVVKDAYRYAQRPASYSLATTAHPSYNDPFDAVMGGAVVLRGKVAGRPIPNLDATAYQAACGYYGACADAVANYAQAVIARAKLWESESALNSPSPSLLDVPPGSKVAQLVALATQIGELHIPYCHGGGHASTPGPSPATLPNNYCHSTKNAFIYGDTEPGLDCSGAVRWLLVSVGFTDPGGISSGEIGGWLQPGPGRWVSVYYNADHTFMSIAGGFWGTSDFNYRGGPDWVASESTAGYSVAHPPGL